MFNILHITFHTNCMDSNKLQINLSVLLLLSSGPCPLAPVEVLVAMAIVASIQHLVLELFNNQILLIHSIQDYILQSVCRQSAKAKLKNRHFNGAYRGSKPFFLTLQTGLKFPVDKRSIKDA